MALIPGWGRTLGGGNGSPFQYSCLGNPIDRGAQQVAVHGVTEQDMTEAAEYEHAADLSSWGKYGEVVCTSTSPTEVIAYFYSSPLRILCILSDQLESHIRWGHTFSLNSMTYTLGPLPRSSSIIAGLVQECDPQTLRVLRRVFTCLQSSKKGCRHNKTLFHKYLRYRMAVRLSRNVKEKGKEGLTNWSTDWSCYKRVKSQISAQGDESQTISP